MSCTVDRRKPCHSHAPNRTERGLTESQKRALGHARTDSVRVLISACGPDAATAASVQHMVPYWYRKQDLPHWKTYKSLYLMGLVILVCDNAAYPYDYKVRPNPAHPLNRSTAR